MYSNEGTSSFSNHNTEEVDNLEQVEEIKLENSLDQYPLALNVQDSVEEIKQLSTSGTQTPLRLIRLSSTQSSSDKRFIDSTYSSTRFDYETTESRDNAKSFSYAPPRCKTSVTLSREATTQATPPHPSLTLSISRTLRDTLQLSTSFSSCKSGPRNEILTVTTDYGSPSPDTFSVLADTADGNDNQDLQDSYVYTYSSPNGRALENNVSMRETDRRRWRLNNCLRFMSTVNNEVLNFA
ncbi:uncharacterized protein LOC143155337 [Ptiloglossa arizonensis]|uniref:uncharacterized protein LOC143155337 n=1 Tax=Ptiloglossa arizonensis TaxID=3350558 RepID=UPI003F9F587A